MIVLRCVLPGGRLAGRANLENLVKLCKQHHRQVLAIPLLGLAAQLAACRQAPHSEDSEEPHEASPVTVRCVAASLTTLRPSVELVGRLVSVPEKTAVLSTQVAGQIRSIAVVEGQQVHEGDELLQLDNRSAEAQRAKARAAVEENRAVVARLKNGSRPEEIDVARQELRRSEGNLRLTGARLESGTHSQELHLVAGLELSQRRTAVEDAEAEVAANQAKLRMLQAGPRPEEIAEAEAKLAGAEADLATAELAFELTRITAPFDGIVSELPVRQGMYVSTGSTLLTLTDISNLFAHMRVPTAYLAQIEAGQTVDVRVASYPEGKFSGTVARVGGQADAQTGNVDAFVSVPNPNDQLRPGLACRLQIWLPEIEDAVVVPIAAVADREGASVVTVVRDDKAHEVEVHLGRGTSELVQIVDGLSEGDLVAIEGGYGLPDGCPCKVVSDSSAPEEADSHKDAAKDSPE